MRCVAIILALLTGCATVPDGDVVPVRWVKMTNITDKCGTDAAGCYRMVQGVCTVYTRPPRDAYDERVHNVLGHETRHCFEGDFHPKTRYVDFRRLAK
jgi:hypothetical protein